MKKKKNLKKTYDFLQSKRKGIKKRAVLFALFLLAVNTYAWFVYVSKADISLDASVNGWDIDFYEDGSTVTNDITINVNIKPGMDDFNKKIVVKNDSLMDATFSYEIDKYTLFGTEYTLDTSEERQALLTALESDYPFSIYFTCDKTELAKEGDTLTFEINVKWPFESADSYYKLTNVYTYQEGIDYYTKSGDIYTIDETVGSGNFLAKVASGLYVESDDADSYFGERSVSYNQLNNGASSLSFHITMKVVQKEETT